MLHTTPREAYTHLRKIWIVAIAIMLGYLLLCLPFFDRRGETCAACRLDRHNYRFLLVRWSTLEESECSRWYSANVEPSHSHEWARYSHCQRIGFPGLISGWGCSFGPPITDLSKSVQLKLYQRFADPMEAKRLFLQLVTRDNESYRLMQEVSEWAFAECPGTWAEWQAKRDETMDDL